MKTGMAIQGVADRTGLSAHTLRYYERIGLIPFVRRAPNGHRRYSEDDVDWIEFLKCLRSTGMPVSDMQRYVELQQQDDDTFSERLELLKAHRRRIKAKIRELNGFLEKIEGKIGYYQELKDQQVN